jgi:hypothetical protein
VDARSGPRAAGAGRRAVRRRHVRPRRGDGVHRSARPRIPAANLASWRFEEEEGTWSTPGGTDHNVTAFATLDGRSLVVGGWFDHAGPIAASAVVEHDPAAGTWTAYGSGIGFGPRSGPTVRALAQSPADGLWVGGTFTVAGGAPSGNLALWRGTAGRAP